MSVEFNEKLEEYITIINEELPAYLPDEPCLQQAVHDAMSYSLLGGGKRIRAVLTLAFCHLAGGDVKQALPFAAAIEMIHAYSLIHDDLPCMDDDDLRRGKPSCHIAYGEANALLAGDGLLTLAFETILNRRNTMALPPDRILAAASQLALAAGTRGMIGGQVIDLENEHKQIPKETLDHMYGLKTGALIRAAVAMGCIVAGADPELTYKADIYAQNIGLAFQIVDDILDVTSDEATLGKPIGSDQENNKTTYATLLDVEECKEIVKNLVLTADIAIKGTKLDNFFLYELASLLADRKS